MIYEYAIDPKLLVTCSDKIRGRLLLNNFGFGTPRIFSVYPKASKWKKMVYEAFSELAEENLGDIKQQAKLQFEKNQNLTALMQGLIEPSIRRPDLVWNPDETWLANVLSQHEKFPFRGLLSSKPSVSCSEVIDQDNFESGEHPSWVVDEQVDVPSNPSDMAHCLEPLLRMAKRIIFIDPYFRAKRPDFIRTFREFFQIINSNYRNAGDIKLEIQCSSEKYELSSEFFQGECKQYFSKIIPSEMCVTFKRWKRCQGGEELHNRYVLTDFGGVKVDPGFDERTDGALTEFILLKKEHYLRRWDQYANGMAFQLAEEPFSIAGVKL